MSQETELSRSHSQSIWILAAALAALFSGLAIGQSTQNDERYGGTLTVAVPADPEILDIHATTADATAIVASHWMEPLVAFDDGYIPQPHLAQDVAISEDGLTYTFVLRQGIMFHNEEQMTADDVVASLRRWTDVSVRGSTAAPFIDEIRSVDEFTVELKLTEPFAPLLSLLANPNSGGVIYPASVVDEFGGEPIQDPVGTGPYRFVEWLPDRHILVERFDGYQAVDAEPSLYSGRRTAYFDQIRFVPVPDSATRIAGTQTGEYQVGHRVTRDAYDQLVNDPSVEPLVTQPDGWLIALINKREGPLTDPVLRRALNAALDMESILGAAGGPEQFWNLEHNYMVGDTPFRTDAGAENYNVADPERARELAEEAGYDGEPIRWLVASNQQDHFTATQVAVAQLQAAGFNVEMQTMEWATLLDRRQQPEVWELFTTTGGFVPDPALLTVITDTYPGWWEDERRAELVARLNSATTLEQRQAVWDELQTYIYEVMPSIFMGEIYSLQVVDPRLQGLVSVRPPFFWNTWME